MSPVPDQTKWVGIRPTDPPENIPTTESAPLTDILVAPSAGNPQFQTRTEKRAPAISDLQAIKDNYAYHNSYPNQDCRVKKTSYYEIVPAGEIWVINIVSVLNETSLCDMMVHSFINATGRQVKGFYSIEPGILVTWQGEIYLTEDDRLYTTWELGGLTDDIKIYIHGYKIGVY